MMRPHIGVFLGECDPAKLAARPMHGLPESDFVEAATIGTAKRFALLHLLGEVRAPNPVPVEHGQKVARPDRQAVGGLCHVPEPFLPFPVARSLAFAEVGLHFGWRFVHTLDSTDSQQELFLECEADAPAERDRSPLRTLSQDIFNAVAKLDFRHAVVAKNALQFAAPDISKTIAFWDSTRHRPNLSMRCASKPIAANARASAGPVAAAALTRNGIEIDDVERDVCPADRLEEGRKRLK